MPLDVVASVPVRPMSEIPMQNGGAAETAKPDFALALDRVLMTLDRLMPQRQRAEALARARREILAPRGATGGIGRQPRLSTTTCAIARKASKPGPNAERRS
jgi:hypothetical protein